METTYQPIKRGMTEAVTRGELEKTERDSEYDAAIKEACLEVIEGGRMILNKLDRIEGSKKLVKE